LYFRKSHDSLSFVSYEVMEGVERLHLPAHEQLVYTERDTVGTSRKITLNSFRVAYVTLTGSAATSGPKEKRFSLRYERFPSHITQLQGFAWSNAGGITEVQYSNWIVGYRPVTFSLSQAIKERR